MVVQHNLTAMNANRYLGINNSKLSKSLEKLSSGYAINRAGDNAAGLAVSEKMRSQIAGMTQAVKNAQDGISMVQTFEGALTETDSILQRMKTLADQMANGTYDDPVDRTAAQQEFLQLNDELDQIADTDFNGVVVLNGGVMSDGVKADANGLIDYRAAKAAAGTAGEAADVGADETHAVLDNAAYNKDVADDIWEAAGIDKDVTKAQITFTYDGEKWVGTSVVDSATGKVIKGADASAITTAAGAGAGTGKGGFVMTAGDSELAAVFNEMNIAGTDRPVQAGDTITFEFENTNDAKYAPNNAAIAEDSFTPDDDSVKGAADTIKFELDAGLTDDVMTEDIAKALDALKEATFDTTYTAGVAGAINMTDASGLLDIDANGVVTVKADGTTLGTVTAGDIEVNTPATGPIAEAVKVTAGTAPGGFALDAGTATATQDATVSYDSGAGTWSVTYADGTTATPASWTAIKTEFNVTAGAAPTADFTFEYTAAKAANPGGNGPDANAAGKVEFKVDVDAYNAPADAPVEAHVVETSDAAKEAAAGFKVSISDAFKNSETLMTYKESIILQAGARTKDAVEFTFKYNSEAIGDLTADLNCTAKGLGTDKLTLSTQKDANKAIDKIDQAINKVSLVRGTFGAIQNRLEHKIDNLNVSVENLTSAESQIRDTNMPQEMMNFTKQQILAQASQSMLAQANQLPQGVLSLLQ